MPGTSPGSIPKGLIWLGVSLLLLGSLWGCSQPSPTNFGSGCVGKSATDLASQATLFAEATGGKFVRVYKDDCSDRLPALARIEYGVTSTAELRKLVSSQRNCIAVQRWPDYWVCSLKGGEVYVHVYSDPAKIDVRLVDSLSK